MPSKFVQLAREDHIAHVRLNRPPVNALGRDLVAELTNLAKYIHQDKDVWVITLQGSGRVFCAGADLKERAIETQSHVRQTVKRIQDMVVAWSEVPQPVLAAIHGAALGGGLELALAADILVATETAKLGFPEVSLGIIPAGSGTQRLAQRTTRGVANKWVLSGSQFEAPEALEDGVVDYVFPQASFEQEFNRLVAQVASCAPIALRQAKKALNAQSRQTIRRGLKAEADCYALLIPTEDRTEALRAFAEKRKPVWRGK